MSKPYDATSKDLIEGDPAGWVAFLGRPVPPSAVRLVDADVSTVTAGSDKVIRVDDDSPWLLHVELQASADVSLPRRLVRYNVLLHHRHELPVASVVVVLRPEANATNLTGQWDMAPPVGPPSRFSYEVVRVWQRPTADFLAGPLGLLPFAPLTTTAAELPAVIGQMAGRLRTAADRPMVERLWSSTYVLMGLRFEQAVIDRVTEGVLQMEESVTYQAILRRGLQQGIQQGIQQGRHEGESHGRVEHARALLLRLARRKFGPPPLDAESAIRAIDDVDRLDSLTERVADATGWDDLLVIP